MTTYGKDTDMTSSRRFLSVMQVTLDGYILGPEGEADWVQSWSDGLALLPEVDAFVLGGGMYPGYEAFWTAVRDAPESIAEWLGRGPLEREHAYAKTAARTPHLVLSSTLDAPGWPSARLVGSLEELRAYRAQPGGPVYVVGGPGLVRSLLDAGLIDELRLVVHPVVVGSGTPLFAGPADRLGFTLVAAEPAPSDRVQLTYRPAHVA